MKNINGGGKNTNLNGLGFESIADVRQIYEKYGYHIDSTNECYFGEKQIGKFYKKTKIKDLIKSLNLPVVWTKGRYPDDSLYVYKSNTLYVFEYKNQESEGSTDDKIGAAPYILFEYKKQFCSKISNIKIIYILNDFFKKEKYFGLLEFLKENGVKYYFNNVDLNDLGFTKCKVEHKQQSLW